MSNLIDKISEESIFYLQARWILKEDAKNILENKDSIDIKAYLMLQMFEKLGESLFI